MEADDLCRFGHQLVPGSDPIRIRELGDSGQVLSEETVLLRRHAPFGSPKSIGRTEPGKVVAYPCDHAIPQTVIEIEYPDELPAPPFRGPSYGRAHWLSYDSVLTGSVVKLRALCPVCRGEAAPADWRA